MSLFERWLTLWVALCILVGLVLGNLMPGLFTALAGLEYASVNLVVAVLIFIANSLASPYFLDPWNLSDATFNFTEKAMIAFAMALVIISGEIDLSVASIMGLSAALFGYLVNAGTPAGLAILVCLAAVNSHAKARDRNAALCGPKFRISSTSGLAAMALVR